MAWVSTVLEDERWCQAMEEALGGASAEELGVLQERRGTGKYDISPDSDTEFVLGIRRQPDPAPLQHHQRGRDRSNLAEQSPLHADYSGREELSILCLQRRCFGRVAGSFEEPVSEEKRSGCEEERTVMIQ